LTFKEFELAWCLAQNAERVISRRRLRRAISGGPDRGSGRGLAVHLTRLRKKTAGSQPWMIKTVPRRGYVLTSENEQRPANSTIDDRADSVGGTA